ncbi:putative disease resistance protein RGA4 [Macadamia integrifolia]|uniref:putative disease resistance protein RGA4 n=1 Tax=Macadamia integrifolia TaxID=60698 RepID=UPI001C4E99E7|nr:putative disease resistance protein RGA4 [Macadamia integrifolia]
MNFQSLRVLDVRDCNMNEVSVSLRKLKHLRYLNLSHNPIQVLPEFITSLYNLQTLKLNHCSNLRELPKEMRKMVSLRHIELCKLDKCTEMPVEMGRLTNLQTLTYFIVGKDGGRSIKQLKYLNLGGELTICGLENVTSGIEEAREANLRGKDDIRSLTLLMGLGSWNGVDSESDDVLEGLEPHPNLKKCLIQYFVGAKYPTWMANGFSAYKNLTENSIIAVATLVLEQLLLLLQGW